MNASKNFRLFTVVMGPDDIIRSSRHEVLSLLQEYTQATYSVWGPMNHWAAPVEYEAEAACVLNNVVVVHETWLDVHALAEYKAHCNGLEVALAQQGKRLFNLNPGIIDSDGVVAVSRKPKPWRYPIANDCWGQQVLVARDEALVPSEHTFTEYWQEGRLERFSGLWSTELNRQS